MANKSNIIKNYLKDIGTKNQVFLMFGNTPNTSVSNTGESQIDVWKNSEMSYRVARQDSVAVIPNISWASGNVYNYWNSKVVNSGQFYVWNKTNNIVYLCMSNNSLNRKDLSLSTSSTFIPSHSANLRTYEDGYTWLPVYKIGGDLLRFVTSTWIPVISFDDYRTNDNSRYTQAQKFCSNDQAEKSTCAVYAKHTMQIPASSSTFTTIAKGTKYVTISGLACGDCYYLYENNDDFISSFSSGTPPATLTIQDKFDEVADLVNSNQISPSSSYYSLYTISANGLEDGAIASALLDLSSFDAADLVVTESNPLITITSSSGTGAELRFKTYLNAAGNNIINGVDLVSSGQNYKDISLSISYGKFTLLTNLEVDSLLASIEIHLDIIDGLNFDPVAALGSENVMFDVRLETNILKQQGTLIPEQVNFYGLVENPIENLTGGLEIVAGSQYGKDLSYIESSTTKVSLLAGTAPKNPGRTTATTVTGSLITDVSIVKIGTSGGFSTANLTGLNFNDASNISTLTVDAVTYTVKEVLDFPVFKQYSGKVSQTKKLPSALVFGNDTTNNENTKIFRINIVKGL
jgi:hypothetical protein